MNFKRNLKPVSKVDLVPMIDVVFQLVIFFMVSSTFIQAPGIPIILPESSTAESLVMSKLIVTVVSRDTIYLNKEKYNLEELNTALAVLNESERRGINTVVIEGDENISYRLMVEVLDILRKNSFRGVNLKMKHNPVKE